MKFARRITILVTVAGWACSGDVPEPLPQEAPPVRGVSGRAPAAEQGVPSVVALRPSAGGAPSAEMEPAVLDQLGLAFMPPQLFVRTGQPVLFTNSESLAHNVHVTHIDTDSTVYNADMGPSQRSQIVLEQEGGYDVTCDVHPGMRAFIFVASAPYAVFAEVDGMFTLGDVPAGSYTASVWSVARALRGTRAVEISGAATVLDLSSFQ